MGCIVTWEGKKGRRIMVQHAQLHPHKCEGQYIQHNTSHCTTQKRWWCVCDNTKHKRLHHLLHNHLVCITPTFSRSPWWGEIKRATSPLPSRGPMVGRNQKGYVTPAFSGSHGGEKSKGLHYPCLPKVPMVGRNQYGYTTLAFPGCPWWGEINMARSPLPSHGNDGGEKSIWLHNHCLLGVPMVGRN